MSTQRFDYLLEEDEEAAAGGSSSQEQQQQPVGSLHLALPLNGVSELSLKAGDNTIGKSTPVNLCVEL